jgi:NAD(P)H dehydrogenase (quinone)
VLWPAQRLMIEYLGMDALEPFVAYAAPRIDAEGRRAYLEQWGARLHRIAEDMASDLASR